MTTYNPGTGTELFVAGDFTTAGGAATDHFASWNGSRWRTWNGGPPSRFENAMADDTSPANVFLFAGFAGAQSHTHTRTWDDNGWTLVSASGAAGSRTGAMMTFDSLRNRMVLYGGRLGSFSSSTAVWDGTTWTALPSAVVQPDRYYSQIVY